VKMAKAARAQNSCHYD